MIDSEPPGWGSVMRRGCSLTVLALELLQILLGKHFKDGVTESRFWLNRGALIDTCRSYGLRPARREDDVLITILGILLASVAVTAAIALTAGNPAPASLSLFGRHMPGVNSVSQIFVTGMIVALLFVVGMAISSLAVRRAMRVHRELRELREEHQESLTTLRMEREKFQRELARARGNSGSALTGSDTRAAGSNLDTPVSPFFDES